MAAPGAAVAQAFVSPERWRRWWPDLSLTVTEDRGEKGIRWSVRGGVVGTMELWLEPVLDGVIVHYFLHAEPASASESATEQHARRVAGRAMTFELKREPRGREVSGRGTPPRSVEFSSRMNRAVRSAGSRCASAVRSCEIGLPRVTQQAANEADRSTREEADQ